MKSIVSLSLALTVILANRAASSAGNHYPNDANAPVPFAVHSRIYGGIIASPGTFPYMVPLWVDRISSQGLKFGTFCGASLISDQYLLTAAHCVTGDPEGARVYMGARVISRDSEPGRVEMKIPKENLIYHEHYEWSLRENDIALIKLPMKVNFTREIQPVKLPSRSQTNLENRISVVTGWGAMGQNADNSDVLRYAQLKIKSDDLCKSIYGKYYHPTNICLDGLRQSSCPGDSGGAAVIIEKDRSFTQVGVAAYVSNKGCEAGYPVGYTRVSSYLDWIHQHTGIAIKD